MASRNNPTTVGRASDRPEPGAERVPGPVWIAEFSAGPSLLLSSGDELAMFHSGKVKFPAGVGGLRYGYEVTVEVTSGDRPQVVVSSVTIAAGAGENVAARTVASELAKVRRMAVKGLSLPVTGAGPGKLTMQMGSGARASVPKAAVRSAMKAPSAAREPVTDEKLRLVAGAYLAAQAAGRPTRRAVMNALGPSTTPGWAGKLIHQCRRRTDPDTDAAFLPPAGGTTRPKLA